MPVRFLIVDDVPAQQRLLANVVVFLGGEARLVSSGHDALQLVKHETFDVVLMDLHMPEMGGAETADQMIQSWAGNPYRPLLLAVTGDTRSDSRALCRAIGMDGFITKPYAIQSLRDAFRELLIRRFSWLDGPSRRVLSLDKLKAALPKHQGDFEIQALEARSTLSELYSNLTTMELEICRGKAHRVGDFAHRYGFVMLELAMAALMQAAEQGPVASFKPLLQKQQEDFELAYDAVRSWRSQSPMPQQHMLIA